MTTETRRIAIPGTSNLRDVGGYRTGDGRTVAYRTLYRGEALVMPGGSSSYAIYNKDSKLEYRDLGVRTIVDLRAQTEIDRASSAWPLACGATLVELPIAEGGEGADTNYMAMLLDGRMAAFGIENMSTFYTELLERRALVLGAAYRLLADNGKLPMLIHCAAGKDRTGVFIALVLSSIGVSDEDVVSDYALTGLLRPNRVDAYANRFVAAGRDPEIARVLFETPPEALRSMLRFLRCEYGSVTGYLTRAAGVDEDVIVRVKENLLG
ncbi:tyrosine-protein phosphatase [Rhodococcus erythropolis]|uniref:tyrosine-protein phosphatase n=1 Tax=Rhodococcus erythropolis TaxID=1833 RepID=UPI0037968946